jgi:predicted metal-dependent peptidase
LILDLVSRSDFLRHYPLYAYVLSRFEPVLDPSVLAMGVAAHGDRIWLHINDGYFREHPQFLRGILLHEVHHVVLGHCTHARFQCPRYPNLMELAMEVSANEYIREALPEGAVTLDELKDWGLAPGQSTTERYELLVQAQEESGKVVLPDPNWIDDHLQDGVGAVHLPEPRALDGAAARVARIVAEAADQAEVQGPHHSPDRGRLAGRHPASILTDLKGTEEPPRRPMDWRTALRMFVAQVRAPRHTYSRPNRRFPERIGDVPGRRYTVDEANRPSLLVAIDTSGSMSDADLAEVGRQLVPLGQLVKVKVVECDAAVHRVYPFAGKLLNVVGRGGTDLRPVFERRFLGEHRPEGVVYFTDGCGPYPRRDPGVKTLWVITVPLDFQCPWGRKVWLGQRREHGGGLPRLGHSTNP